ncbi:MAG: PP2C family protein-serine/threonine phosphatase [Terracidiphilus sp.]
MRDQRKSPDATRKLNPWTTVPKRTAVIFLAAVFFTFSSIGVAGDISDMGRQLPVRFAGGVLLSGLIAVIYAWTGVKLRGRAWVVFVPLFLIQIIAMKTLSRHFPNPPIPTTMNEAQIDSLADRLNYDSIAIILATLLAYLGFVFVFVGEFRRRMRVTTEKAVLDTEMAAAREIQQVIVPEQAECFIGFCVESVYVPAQQVGGDFFQILPDADGGMLVVIGDVTGKGLPAAMLVSMLVGSIRTAVEDTCDPARILRKLHDRLLGRGSGGYSTAIAARIGRDGTVTMANAGHLPPYLDGKEIELAGTLPLGFAGGGQYQTMSFVIAPGSRLVFCTDGVVEAQNGKGELFGFERTRQISTKTAVEIGDAAREFGQSDDITVVAIERNTASSQ